MATRIGRLQRDRFVAAFERHLVQAKIEKHLAQVG
jgi:hypothetical protein